MAIVYVCDNFYFEVRVYMDKRRYTLKQIRVNNEEQLEQCLILTRLQQILLKLQRYNVVVKYKKGTTIQLADTLITTKFAKRGLAHASGFRL